MQARVGNDIDRLAEPHHQRLFGHIHREDRTIADHNGTKQQQQHDDTCDGRPHRVAPLGCDSDPVVAGG